MKHLIALAFVLFPILHTMAQGTFTVDIRIEDQRWRDGIITPTHAGEWLVDLYADLYFDGTPVPPDGSYFYTWKNYRNGSWVVYYAGADFGLYHLTPDGETGWEAPTYVVVDFGGGIKDSSWPPINAGKSGERKTVHLFAKRWNGSHINESVSIVNFEHWMGNNWESRLANSVESGVRHYNLTPSGRGN